MSSLFVFHTQPGSSIFQSDPGFFISNDRPQAKNIHRTKV